MAFDVDSVRADFPILQRRLTLRDGSEAPLIYFDHGASTHAPRQVIDAVNDLMTGSYANIHRGNHTLSMEASDLFDQAADTIAGFVGAAPDTHTVIFGQNTTMALDMAAHAMAGKKGKTLTTVMEHHSNDLPHRNRGDVVHAQVDDQGRVLLDDVQRLLDEEDIKLLAVTGASNVTGYMPPIGKLARMAHDADARVLIDAAQLYAHAPIDVRDVDHPEHIDFLAVAGHKAYAPYGSAALVAPKDVMDEAPPYLPGGGTVTWVSQDSAMYAKSPDRHMGGTPNIAGAVAFAAATRYLDAVGMDNVRVHEEALIGHALKGFEALASEHGVELFGPRTVAEKGAVFSFMPGALRHDDVSATLDGAFGIATRNGCFCAHPLLHCLLHLTDTSQWTEPLARGEPVDLPGAVRAAVGIYNTESELDHLFDALDQIMVGKVPLESVKAADAVTVSSSS